MKMAKVQDLMRPVQVTTVEPKTTTTTAPRRRWVDPELAMEHRIEDLEDALRWLVDLVSKPGLMADIHCPVHGRKPITHACVHWQHPRWAEVKALLEGE